MPREASPASDPAPGPARDRNKNAAGAERIDGE